jgi:hypothetical protein
MPSITDSDVMAVAEADDIARGEAAARDPGMRTGRRRMLNGQVDVKKERELVGGRNVDDGMPIGVDRQVRLGRLAAIRHEQCVQY